MPRIYKEELETPVSYVQSRNEPILPDSDCTELKDAEFKLKFSNRNVYRVIFLNAEGQKFISAMTQLYLKNGSNEPFCSEDQA